MEGFGERFKKVRLDRGLTQKGLGEILGVSQETISQIEKGKINPSFEVVCKIATIYEVDLNWLFLGKESFLGKAKDMEEKLVLYKELYIQQKKLNSIRDNQIQ